MTSKTSTLRFYSALLLFIASALLLLQATSVLYNTVNAAFIPFDTDEADHANAGIELYYAIKNFDPTQIINATIRQAFYPPIHSFFVALSYFLSGVGIPQSRVPSVFLYLLSGVALSLAAYRLAGTHLLGRSAKYIAGALPLACFAASPLLIDNAALSMLELCGVFFTTLILLVTTYSSGMTAPILLSLLVMLTKYSFGILAFPGVAFGYLLGAHKPYLTRRSILNTTQLNVSFIFLFGLWCLISDRKSIFHFFVGHPSYAPLLSAENLLFEFRSWIFEYNASPLMGSLLLLSAIYGGVSLWHYLSIRIAVGISLSSFAVLALSTTNESRHFIVAAPSLWFLAAMGWARLWSLRQTITAPLLLVPLCIFLIYNSLTLSPSIPKRVFKEMEGKPEFNDLQEALISAIDCSQPVLFIGVSDQFGIEALRWRGALACEMPYTQIRFDSFPYRDDKNRTAQKRKRNLDKPYIDSSFPKEPIDSIFATGYYQSLVMIRDIGARGSTPNLIKELKERFSEHKTIQASKGGKEITIIQLN